jgi:high-affinity K+ transport system ATPase subunit B
MTFCGITANKTEAQRINSIIDKQIRAERKKTVNEVKLLLLGMTITSSFVYEICLWGKKLLIIAYLIKRI